MSSSGYEGGEGVIGRKLVFCPRLQTFETDELIRTCEHCSGFFVYCCGCRNDYGNDGRYPDGRICHHLRLIFVDGACSHNGQSGATAGVGIARGADKESQLSFPIDTDWDPGQKRTSQRAELLAAQAGLRYLAAVDDLKHDEESDESKKTEKTEKAQCKNPNSEGPGKAWIIATDSEYVAKGMTEWLPQWKVSELMHCILKVVNLSSSDGCANPVAV